MKLTKKYVKSIYLTDLADFAKKMRYDLYKFMSYMIKDKSYLVIFIINLNEEINRYRELIIIGKIRKSLLKECCFILGQTVKVQEPI